MRFKTEYLSEKWDVQKKGNLFGKPKPRVEIVVGQVTHKEEGSPDELPTVIRMPDLSEESYELAHHIVDIHNASLSKTGGKLKIKSVESSGQLGDNLVESDKKDWYNIMSKISSILKRLRDFFCSIWRRFMLNNQILAINSIITHGEDNGWCPNTQLIVTCDFISENNLDEKFERYLKKRGDDERKMSDG